MLGRDYFLICDVCRQRGPRRSSAKAARTEARRRWRRVARGDERDRQGGSAGKDLCPSTLCRRAHPEAK